MLAASDLRGIVTETMCSLGQTFGAMITIIFSNMIQAAHGCELVCTVALLLFCHTGGAMKLQDCESRASGWQHTGTAYD